MRVDHLRLEGSDEHDRCVCKFLVGANPALRGLQPGDSVASSFDGELGFIDCADNGIVVQMGGTDGGETGSGVVFPDGSCVLNPTPIAVPTADGSVGQLKARF